MPSPGQAVFLSYAREDSAAAQRICGGLRAAGIEVWFDQSELRGGDAWDQKIRKQIKDCTLFLPVISANTEDRGEGYFRLEWTLAEKRAHHVASGVPFLLPVVIDGTTEADALVPELFRERQWQRLPHGEPTEAFVAQVRRLLEAPRGATRKVETTEAPFREAPGTITPSSSAKVSAQPRRYPWPVLAAAAVVVAGGIWFLASRSSGGARAEPMTQGQATAAAPPLPAIPTDKSIAVLPFENMSDDKADMSFTDGMHESILTTLFNVREFRLAGYDSVALYRGTTKPNPQIAQELNMAYLLRGSIRRAGNTIRITGRLVLAKTGEEVWRNDYRRDLTADNLFAIQEAIATEIAAALKATLSPEETKLLARRPTSNLAAYEAYLRAQATKQRMAGRGGQTLLGEQDRELRESVRLAPDFALAWAELANVQALHQFWEYDLSSERVAQGNTAMETALRLAPNDPEILRRSGLQLYWGGRDYAGAGRILERLLNAQPNDAETINALGLIQRRQGKHAEALANLQKAVRLDPGSAEFLGALSGTLVYAHRWDEHLAVQRRLFDLAPGSSTRQLNLLQSEYRVSGSFAETEKYLSSLSPKERELPEAMQIRRWQARLQDNYPEWKRLDSLLADDPTLEDWIGSAMFIALHGDLAAARARLGNRLDTARARLQREPENVTQLFNLAQMEAVLGEKEAALQHARRAVALSPESLDAIRAARARYILASVYAWTGDKDQAIRELEHLVTVPGGIDTKISNLGRGSGGLAPLRGEPRFEAIINDPKNQRPLF
jgi:TolB-like protein/Flp pilus assembly protein TadD